MPEIGNYIKRQGIADDIVKKIMSGKTEKIFTKEEERIIIQAVKDPLQEFCQREGTFRLVEMHNIDPEKANELEDAATEEIRDTIDYNEDLYDTIDNNLRDNIINKKEK